MSSGQRRRQLCILFALVLFSVFFWNKSTVNLKSTDDGRMNPETSSIKDVPRDYVLSMNTVSPRQQVYTTTSTSSDGRMPLKTNKPFLVLHVGPPKTATTSLQTEFTQLNATLALDNYLYAGRYYHPDFDGKLNKFVPNREDTRLGEIVRDMFKPSNCNQTKTRQNLVECVTALKKELDSLSNTTGLRNILLSDEGLTKSFQDPEFFVALRDAIGQDWDVIIIVGYRRFFEWLPSDMFQRYRMDKDRGENNWKNNWPSQNGPGEKVTLLLPFYYTMWSELGHIFANTVLESVGDAFPVKILNLHANDTGSLRSQFLCDALPNAPQSCKESRTLDVQNDSIVMNDAKAALHVNYDMLAVGAAELGLIDVNQHKRKFIREAIRNYTEVYLGQGPWDFALKCPSQKQFDELLEMTLDLEVKCLGKEMAEQMESLTRSAFESNVQSGMFCEIDAEATVLQEPWKTFFAQYGP